MAKFTFTSNRIRHIIRVSLALLIALLVSHYFSATPEGWIMASTFFVMLTQRGSALYQGLLHFLILMIMVAIVTLIFSNMDVLYSRASEISIGAMIGIAANLLIFPDRVDREFRETLIPILESFALYFSSIVSLLLRENMERAEIAKIRLEEELEHLPLWIYSSGFDITLQKGHRYFFMKISQISEILFTLHHAARNEYDPELLNQIQKPLKRSQIKIEKFIMALTTVLDLKKLTENVQDFYAEITEIENDFKHLTPLRLELIDNDKKYVYFAMFIYTLKEFHDALLRLAKTLR